MDVVTAARSLIADTLGFHIIFAALGVGLPLLISSTELFGLVTKRPRAVKLAHAWSKALVILFIAGAISGTIVSLQFSLLWPTFMALAGKVVGLAFALEGFAFLIEALFLGVYMLSWDRFKPWAHWLCSLPIVLGSMASAFFITTVNGWMNTPRGFQLDASGNPVHINTRQAVFNPAAGTEILHSILAYIFATVLVVMAVYAWIAWRHKIKEKIQPDLQRLILGLAIVAVVVGLALSLAGDQSGKFDAKNEPYKLAAAEGLQTTQNGAPLLIGGVVKSGTVEYAIKVPHLLSWLATGRINGQVKGLDQTLPADRPPLIIHYFFDAMVLIGIVGVLAPLIYIFGRWKKSLLTNRYLLVLLVVCGVLGFLGIEFGWMLTEFGRQPYVIRGVMLTKQAATSSRSAVEFGYLFPLFYIALFILSWKALRRRVAAMEAFE